MSPTVSIVLAIFGGLASAGAFKFFTSYGTRLAIAEHTLKENNLPSIVARLLVLEQGIMDMKPGLQKLSQLDAMHEKLTMLAGSVDKLSDRVDQALAK